jgi:hypothetical protein
MKFNSIIAANLALATVGSALPAQTKRQDVWTGLQGKASVN